MRTLNPLFATALLATATLAGATGCADDNYYYDDSGRYGYYEGSGDGFYDDNGYYVLRRDVYYDDGGPYYFVGGRRYFYRGDDWYRRHRDDFRRVAHERVRVPRDASVVANGDRGLHFSPDQAGRVYVRDEKTGKVIYRGRVQPGDDVKVAADAKGRHVSVNGETAHGDLSAKPRDRELYFRPDRGTVSRSDSQARPSAASERPAAHPSHASDGDDDGDGGGRRGKR